MRHAISWFEIPTTDLARAQAFYERMLDVKLRAELFEGHPMAIFPADQAGVGGALIKHPALQPTATGGVVYLDTHGTLDACLARVKAAGGSVTLPRTDIGPPGFIAWVVDSEGNTVGLHQARG